MTEAFEQIAIRKTPLDETHQRLGAKLTERDGWSMPATYGDVLSEYATVREGPAGLIDLSSRGRILVSGTEAVQFLNGLVTNDMKTLDENRWMPAAFPNVQGRLIASVRIVRLKDEESQTTAAELSRRRPSEHASPMFLLDTEAATHQQVLKTIERFTLAGDFHVTDITDETTLLTVQGKRAVEVVRSVMGDAVTALPSNGAIQIAWQQSDVRIIRATHTAEDGFDLIVNSSHATAMWNALQNAGAQPVGYDALEILRIEAGLALYGSDMDETNVVTETNLDDAVSFTKGCYVGQEIIARIKYRGHVAKKLTGLLLDETAKIEAGTGIKSVDNKEIGRITSAAHSPRLGSTIALGYVKYEYLAAETSVKIISGNEELDARITQPPFVRGSWHESS